MNGAASTPAAGPTDVHGIAPSQLQEQIASTEVTVLDVREDSEWAAGRIPGSVHMPVQDVAKRYRAELDRKRPVIVVCRSGDRSARVAQALQRAGFNVRHLQSGLRAWSREGLPLEPEGDGRIL